MRNAARIPFARSPLTLASVALGAALAFSGQALAGPPETLEVQIDHAGAEDGMNFFNITATIRHADEGWKHYANRFEVLDAATGKLLGERKLLHPHENEQPFTRTLYRLPVPQDVTRVLIRAHDSVHGYEDPPLEVALPDLRG